MKERGILFQAPLVRALLAGTKSQTRRLLNPQPTRTLPNEQPLPSPSGAPWTICRGKGWRWQKSKRWSSFVADEAGLTAFADSLVEHCPYGVPGDRLWVRETWGFDSRVRAAFKPTGRHDLSGMDLRERLVFRADDSDRRVPHWRPAIHLPRWASRITLEVTEVRVQRVDDISEEDAKAEGVTPVPFCRAGTPPGNEHREAFQELWDAINSERASWSSNPWVWSVSFRRLIP